MGYFFLFLMYFWIKRVLILENAAVLLWGILFETKCVLISCHHQKLRLQNFLSFFLGFGVFRLQVLISDVLIKKTKCMRRSVASMYDLTEVQSRIFKTFLCW